MQLAMKGNAALLIWLGKQLLGQKDKIENGLDEDTRKALAKSDAAILARFAHGLRTK